MKLGIPHATQSIKFAEAGSCIYCGPKSNEPFLGVEHIIPEGLGGLLKLPKSSCKSCEKIISPVELRVIRHVYGDVRAQIGTRRKKRKKYSDNFSVFKKANGEDVVVTVALKDHPGLMSLIGLNNVAGIFREAEKGDGDWGTANIALWAPHNNLEERIRNLGGRAVLSQGIEMDDWGRFLAKIAHSYAVAKLGLKKFEAYLPQLILGEDLSALPFFIGKEIFPVGKDIANDAAPLHSLYLYLIDNEKGETLIVVKLRLFSAIVLSDFLIPTYDIVVGHTTEMTPQP